MSDTQHSYATSRVVYQFAEFVGWSVVIGGGVMALVGFQAVGYFMYGMPGGVVITLKMLGAVPGVAVMVSGVAIVTVVQLGRAHVNTAEMMHEVVTLMKRDRARSQSMPSFGTEPPSEPQSLAPPASSENKSEFYRGLEISRKEGGYYIAGSRFESMSDAQGTVDAAIKRRDAKKQS